MGNRQAKKRLGNLSNASRFYHRRAALTLREPRGFVLIRVHAPELLAIGVVNADQPMMVFAAAVSAKCILVFFCHFKHPSLEGPARRYLREARSAQVPTEILTRYQLHEKAGAGKSEMAHEDVNNSPSLNTKFHALAHGVLFIGGAAAAEGPCKGRDPRCPPYSWPPRQANLSIREGHKL